MSVSRLLRNAWMDLASATAFLLLWLLRDHLEYDTLREWLLWPVIFELFVSAALLLAGMLETTRSNVLRNGWFALVASGFVFAAWLCGELAGMPHVWVIAIWLLLARLLPPSGMRFGEAPHRAWVKQGAGLSGLLWAAGFLLTLLLMFAFSSTASPDADGQLRSSSPAWIFPLVWVPYFLAEALIRAWRAPTRT